MNMRVAATLIAVSVTLAAASGSAADATNPPERAEIQALFDRTAACLSAGDVEGAAKAAAPDAVIHTLGGTTVSMEQWKAGATRALASVKDLKAKAEAGDMSIEGTSATAMLKQTETFSIVGSDGQPHAMTSESSWRAVVAKGTAGWQVKELFQLSQKMTRDGEPFTPPKR